MTAHSFRVALFTVVVASFGVSAQAAWWNDNIIGDFCHSVGRDFQRRNCWPEPFVCPSRRDVETPMAIMINNGWRRQNMLAEHHFDAGTGTLNTAGMVKLRWILTEAPMQHRTIYVHRAIDPEETIKRVDHVNQLAASIVPEGVLPSVLETSISERGWPAERVDTIGQEFNKSMPVPRLPKADAAGNE
ncbi:MAG: hypothetical protein V3V75_09020 [Thermoguttaceae bacterium]